MIDRNEAAVIKSASKLIPVGREPHTSTQRANLAALLAVIDAQVEGAATAEAAAANRRAGEGKRALTMWHFWEREVQARIVALAWRLEERIPSLYTFAPINQAAVALSHAKGRELAAVGMVAGVPDLRHDICARGCYVEVKAPGGHCDPNQVEWSRRAWERGTPSYVVYSVAEWVEVIVAELRDERGPEALRDPGRRMARPKGARR